MTTVYGLTAQGLVIKTLDVLRAGANARMQSKFGSSIAVDDESIEGQTFGIMCEQLAILWENLERVNDNGDPDKATYAGQDALCAITGTLRRGATYSTVRETFTGDVGTVIDLDTQVTGTGVGSPTFTTIATGSIAAANAWVTLTVYAVGAIVSNPDADGVFRIYVCTVAGTANSTEGPRLEIDDIQDGFSTPAHWNFVGRGAGYVQLLTRATDTGPLTSPASSLIVIATPVAGLLGVRNLLDSTAGRNLMTNEQLRVFREEEIAQPGTGPADAIRAALLLIPDVISVTVFVNNTDVTDADGVPPHSIEALVQGGLDQSIWNVLLANVAAGIGTYGSSVGTATDSQGTIHAMKFSRPGELLIYATITLVKNPLVYALDGDAAVKAAIATWGDSIANAVGVDVTASKVSSLAFGVDGINDITSVLISKSPTTVPVASTTIAVSTRQLARYATTRISVVSTDGVP